MNKENVQQDPRTLEELGAELRRERESRDLSAEDISTMTCIRVNFIEDIEAGIFTGFVSIVYARGFVRTYLNLLQRQDMWPDYDLRLTSLDKPSAEERSMPQRRAALSPGKVYRRSSRQWLIALFCLLIAGCCVLLWSNRDKFQTGPVPSSVPASEFSPALTANLPQVSSESPVQAEPRLPEPASEVPVSPSQEVSAPEPDPIPEPEPEPEPQPVRPTLTIRAAGDCWFQLRQGGRTIRERTLRSGYEETFDLSQPLRAVFGAAHNVTVSVNGEDRGHPGRGVTRREYRPDGTSVPFSRNP